MSTVCTVWGPIADELGQCFNRAEGRISVWPSLHYRTSQRRAPIRWGHHGRNLGQLEHLEHRGRHLWAVGSVDFDLVDESCVAELTGPLYWSPSLVGSGSELDAQDIEIEELSLTSFPASTGLSPIGIAPGRITDRNRWPLDLQTMPLLAQAEDTVRHRSHGDDRLYIRNTTTTSTEPTRRLLGPIRRGPAGRVMEVHR